MQTLAGSRSRLIVRTGVILFLSVQTLAVAAFLSGSIPEPYPSVLLPGFDQVLEVREGICGFTVPALYAVLESGQIRPLAVEDLFPGVGIKGFWCLARLARPSSGGAAWKPSLPSYGFPLEHSTTLSRGFRQYLLRNAAAAVYPEVLEAVMIRWHIRQFSIAGSYKELPPHVLGALLVQRDALP